MAYAAIVSLAHTIERILNHDRYYFSPHQKQHIIPLHKYAILLQAFLEDWPEKANRLEGRIRDVASEAENIIETFMWEQSRSGDTLIKRISGGPADVKFKHQLAKVIEEIDSVAKQVKEIKNSIRINEAQLVDHSTAASSSSSSSSSPSSSRVAATHKKDAIVGFDDDLLAIKEWLCGESSKLQVIPIVGMGGIGKTTLARTAFEDPLIAEHFHIRVWVTVSHEYTSQKVISSLLGSMKELNTERSGQDDEEKVYKSLKGMRYLILLDDTWSTEVWDDVKRLFPDDRNGSRIMLTTRLFDVAVYPNSISHLHEMRFMDADQSWNLLRQKVFQYQDYCPPELEDIGKEIARNCRGLPLAIVLIGGVLSTTSKNRDSWGKIAENINSTIAAKEGQFEKIMSLSYTHLPHHLRPCFLYLAGFPDYYEIHISKLTKLWVAEGFLKHSNGSKTFEDLAEEYLEDLVKRSLALVAKRRTNGKIKSCSIHDLVRHLCIRKAHEEQFFLVLKNRFWDGKCYDEPTKNGRRISIVHSDRIVLVYGSRIRTLLSFQQFVRLDSLRSSVKFKLLRVMDLLYPRFWASRAPSKMLLLSLPAQVFELIHLRYLAFDYIMDNNTAAISNLKNLETLITRAPLSALPSDIWKLPQLRHIISFSVQNFPCPPEPTLALENLQTLSVARDFFCLEEILKMIPNLRKLGIYFTEGKHLHLENLVHLHQLESFKLKSYEDCCFRQKLNHAFPRTLKKLTLEKCVFAWEDMTFFGSLPNLEVLKLRCLNQQGDTWETNEGEFPTLKLLLIERSDPQNWITERSHFPSLKCLLLDSCSKLREIPDAIGDIPTLELIEVKYSLSSLGNSARRIKGDQEDYGNDALQVRCIRC